ncbi:hypothetical protein BKA80DRAFT_269540 [Phyllosticta citrichinensis]
MYVCACRAGRTKAGSIRMSTSAVARRIMQQAPDRIWCCDKDKALESDRLGAGRWFDRASLASHEPSILGLRCGLDQQLDGSRIPRVQRSSFAMACNFVFQVGGQSGIFPLVACLSRLIKACSGVYPVPLFTHNLVRHKLLHCVSPHVSPSFDHSHHVMDEL